MKIVFLAHYYYPHIGGVEKHVLKISRELTRLGHEVAVIAESHSLNLAKVETHEKVNIHRFTSIETKYTGLLVVWFKLFQKIRLFYSADIVHVHDVFIWYWPIKIVLFWKPVYATFHGWEGVYPIPIKNILIRKISVYLCTKSIDVGAYLQKYYKTKPDKVVYGATDKPVPSEKHKNIIYVGRLEPDTGLEVLLEALLSMGKVNIEFYGDGSMRKKCGKYGRVHGFIDIKNAMASASLCVCGGYLSIIEALASGCRVVSIYNNDIRKDILYKAPFKKYIHIVSSPKETVDVLSEVEKSRDNMDEAGKWANTQTWEKMTQEYLSLWSETK
ncbi:glycosyltransferase [Candidatus Microgenomates bacterium]|nr:MAG: glycosyltransferase [Candidatus Microgenomates bacterium]